MNLYWQYFILISLLLPIVFCPGPMTMFCLSNGMSITRKKSIVAILGGSMAYSIQMFITFIGIDLLDEYPSVIVVIRFVGVFYLAYIGLQYLFSQKTIQLSKNKSLEKNYPQIFLSGFLVAISNPKSIVVYISIFPKYIDPNRALLLQYITLGSLFLVLQFTSAYTYTTLGKYLFSWTRTPIHQLLFRLIVGLALLTASVLLLQT
jgi:homoserine/homoserine lactone efflux protein